jgi:hypothetical protein
MTALSGGASRDDDGENGQKKIQGSFGCGRDATFAQDDGVKYGDPSLRSG